KSKKFGSVFARVKHKRVSRQATGDEDSLENGDDLDFRPRARVGIDDDGRAADIEGAGKHSADETELTSGLFRNRKAGESFLEKFADGDQHESDPEQADDQFSV